MKKHSLFFLIFICAVCSAQENVAGSMELQEVALVKTQTENRTSAVFPNGIEAFKKLIFKKFRLRKVQVSEKTVCQVFFTVDANGNITKIKAIGDNPSLNKESIRAVSKIKEKWVPAEINGIKVQSVYRVPLTFSRE